MTTTITDLANVIRAGLHSGIFDGHRDRKDRDEALAALEELEARAEKAEGALATARAEGAAAERARVLGVIRERAATRWAQAVTCAKAGGNADVVDAKASECEALAAVIDGTATMPRWPGRPVETL